MTAKFGVSSADLTSAAKGYQQHGQVVTDQRAAVEAAKVDPGKFGRDAQFRPFGAAVGELVAKLAANTAAYGAKAGEVAQKLNETAGEYTRTEQGNAADLKGTHRG
ncbi:type VII secretion target [Streptoalloteichus hindustanus]|uniref:Excreted virulence factor EspC, type VII ESX diderm n=1 Tax=Streptoalloteichus hindustanus TaxID=2017 RepID=A0A1M4TC69_STRHI|nr:type VII secretion target [Streptoalloteichus hindustanus]SHE42139.1 Excreted virulence factor EspC, type VII ESX diderm [Streptoalloteichus hindustanus]